MGVKCESNGRSARLACRVAGLADHPLVAEVDAIKDADGQIDRVLFSSQFSQCVKNFHFTKSGFAARSVAKSAIIPL